MITSNLSPLSDSGPGKVERSDDDPANDVGLDRVLKEPPAKKQKSGELAAASALAGLVTSPEQGPVDDKEVEEPADEFVLPEIYTRSGRKKAIPFPLKLMKVLSCREYADIITWLPNGRSFSIIRPKAFTSEILPIHFKEAKYSSFTRKLHRWGFQRHLRGDEAGAFFHKYFVRNRVDLVDKMTCHKPKPHPNRYLEEISPLSGVTAMRNRNMAQHQMSPGMVSARAQSQQEQQQGSQDQDTSDLNQAIEFEVSRRLRERIAAASLSRQALAVMQGQVQGPPMGMASADPMAAMQFMPSMNPRFNAGGALGGMNPAMMNPNPMGMPQQQAAFNAQNLAALRDAQEQCLMFGAGGMGGQGMGGQQQQQFNQGLDMMPNTNISNARGA